MTPLPPSTIKDSNTIMNNCFRVERPPLPPNLTQFKPVHDDWPSNQTFETITYQKLRLSAPASDKFLPDQLPSGCPLCILSPVTGVRCAQSWSRFELRTWRSRRRRYSGKCRQWRIQSGSWGQWGVRKATSV